MHFDLPPVTRALLIANIAAYLLQMLVGEGLIVHFALWPLGTSVYENVAGFQPWQVVTYGFLHGGFTHLAFNMFALWMFGGAIENLFGARPFALYYFTCVIGAALAPTDPAVMFSVLGPKEIEGRSGVTLEGEAGFNDPAGIALMIGMIELATHADASRGVIAREFVVEMGIGAALGVVGALLMAALLRRLTKQGSIPSINTLVDVGNLVSIRHALPVAVFDLASIAGGLTVRFAAGDESFTDLGSGSVESPEPGEVIFIDSAGHVAARRWCWRCCPGWIGRPWRCSLAAGPGTRRSRVDERARARRCWQQPIGCAING